MTGYAASYAAQKAAHAGQCDNKFAPNYYKK